MVLTGSGQIVCLVHRHVSIHHEHVYSCDTQNEGGRPVQVITRFLDLKAWEQGTEVTLPLKDSTLGQTLLIQVVLLFVKVLLEVACRDVVFMHKFLLNFQKFVGSKERRLFDSLYEDEVVAFKSLLDGIVVDQTVKS